MEEIYIILLNYNGYNDTIECIKSIKENEKSLNYKIVVIDNKSTDDSLEKLKEIDQIFLIEAQENKGFASGNNLGIKYALEHGAKYVLLLNNDTIITKDSLTIMYNEMLKHHDLGIIGNRIMYYTDTNTINYLGGKIDWFRGTANIRNKQEKYIEEGIEFDYTEFITGCCMLIKKQTIEDVGYLPEEYFMYYEDVDYCVNVMKKGYKLGISYKSVIYHKEGASSGGKENPFAIKWNTRNRIIFMNKYKCKGIITQLFFYITRIVVGMKYIFSNNKDKLAALSEGINEGRKYLRGVKKDAK